MNVEVIFNDVFSFSIKREDLLHPIISGNKFRKLKYNIIEAKERNFSKVITFGGAYSNHIVAVAAAGFENNIKTIGVIRGDELKDKINLNPTLVQAKKFGMEFYFISREEYKLKENSRVFQSLINDLNDCYLIPEGGTNELAIKGCEEILDESDSEYTHVCCPVGTGGTISGLINSSINNQQIIGFSSLKGDFLSNQISNFVKKENWTINSDYHFGGYGKVTDELITFLNDFYKQTGVPLDPVYTGKMVFGMYDLFKRNYFTKKAKILAIHTGGLQGIRGMNQLLEKKNKEIICYEF